LPEVPSGFASVLRGLRTEAGLTQEELAESAGLTARAISYLERGEVARPRRETVRLLADALRLTGPARAEFEAAAWGRGGADATATAAKRTLPRDVASFTGRDQELAALAAAAAGAGGVVSIHAIGGMAGVGKTAFAVHAAHRLASRFPGGQIFVPLHGHTPGQRPADPADALAGLLLTMGVAAAQVPAGLEARMALWRDRAAGRQLLLILDDAAGSEQVIPLLPGAGGSLVLVTSRRHLSALEDATPVSLDTLPPEQAAELLVRLTGRAGLTVQDRAVGELARLCGYLPLAVGMVARQLRLHPAWTVAGRAAELAAATDRLAVMATENLSVAAAFDLSYAALTGDQQRLFRRLGLHPGPDIDSYAAAALDGSSLAAARRGLEDLYDQHLLTEPAPGRYRLHDLIREHARALAIRTDPSEERELATAMLLDYYQHTAASTNALIARQTRPALAADQATPAAAPDVGDPEQALAWARAERASLLACLDHATAADQHSRVISLTAGISGLLLRDGPWPDAITRHTAAITAAQQLGDSLGQANALHDLGTVRRQTSDYPTAVRDLEEALGIYGRVGSRLGQANALNDLGVALRMMGQYPDAARPLEQALGAYREIGDRLGQASALNELGHALRQTGEYQQAARVLQEALRIYRDLGHRLGEANALNALGIVLQLTGDYPAAARAQEQALGICRDIGHRLGEANALNALGHVLRETGDYPAAARAHEEVLRICRDISHRLGEANALLYLGIVSRLTADYPAAAQVLEQALDIYRHMGHRTGEANALVSHGVVLRLTDEHEAAVQTLAQALAIYRDVGDRGGQAYALNEIGTLHQIRGELTLAEGCHQQALELARAIQSSFDEAHALAGLARCALVGDQAAAGEAGLRQALAIFQQIGAAEAADVAAELDAITGRNRTARNRT